MTEWTAGSCYSPHGHCVLPWHRHDQGATEDTAVIDDRTTPATAAELTRQAAEHLRFLATMAPLCGFVAVPAWMVADVLADEAGTFDRLATHPPDSAVANADFRDDCGVILARYILTRDQTQPTED
jgi:hypothetical protein